MERHDKREATYIRGRVERDDDFGVDVWREEGAVQEGRHGLVGCGEELAAGYDLPGRWG